MMLGTIYLYVVEEDKDRTTVVVVVVDVAAAFALKLSKLGFLMPPAAKAQKRGS